MKDSMTETRFNSQKVVKGERVSLCLLSPEHLQAWLAYKIKNRRFFQPFQPLHLDDHFSIEVQEKHIKTVQEQASNDSGYTFVICSKESKAIIGHVSLSGVSRGVFQNALLGYAMDETYNGKGLMTEAVGLAVQVAFQDLRLHRVQAAVMPHNAPSLRVLEKIGFVQEGFSRRYLKINGVWEDHYIYAILNENTN